MPVAGGIVFPGRVPDMGVARRTGGGCPDGVKCHVSGGHLEAHVRGIAAGEGHPLRVPGREGKAVLPARADGDVGPLLIRVDPGGGPAAAGIADGHLVYRFTGLLTGGDVDRIRRGLALVADGEDLAFRRAGGVKTADHVRRDRDCPAIAVGIHGLNGQASHVQRVAHTVFGFVGGAVDGDGLQYGRAGGRDGDGGIIARLTSICSLHAHIVGPGGKAGGRRFAAGLRASELRV